MAIVVDSNVILDLFTKEGRWLEWSYRALLRYSREHELVINQVIYSEISIRFSGAVSSFSRGFHIASAHVDRNKIGINIISFFQIEGFFLTFTGGMKFSLLIITQIQKINYKSLMASFWK